MIQLTLIVSKRFLHNLAHFTVAPGMGFAEMVVNDS